MVYKNFRFNVIARILLLALLLFALVLIWTNTQWRVTPAVCLLLIVFLIANLIHYVEQTNRDFSQFLRNIHYQDFTARVPARTAGKSFAALNKAYALITQSLRHLKHEKQEYLQLLEAVVDHLNIAVLCVEANGNIVLMNTAAKQLLGTPHLHRIDTLARIDNYLAGALGRLGNGERQLIAASIKGHPVNLSVHNSRFTILDHDYQLISLQNIRGELEQKETEAWQKLTRVLSHEIMNSATPIIALIGAIKDSLPNLNAARPLDDEEHRDLVRSIESIESRSRGLAEFVEAYRGLTHIPAPKIESADVRVLVKNVEQLMRADVESAGIEFQTLTPSDALNASVDSTLIEQALINLIRNATEALTNQATGRITVTARRGERGSVFIDVEDNGPGIDEDNLENIFMPFYTTKAQGSGLGLAISRQILFMNRGFLSVDSKQGEGTRFRLEFNGES